MLKKLLSPPTIDWPGKFKQKLNVIKNDTLIAYYSTPLPEGNKPIGEVEFLSMDFETTGLNPEKDDIISVGTVPFNLQRIFVNRAKYWTVRPREKLEEESVIIHGITHTDILDAPDLSVIFEQILNEMAGKIVVVHCQQIERQFFERALMTRINKGIEFPVVDTMVLESKIQQKLRGGIWHRLKGKKPQSIRLGACRQRYGLPVYPPHHALTDAIATAELLQAQIAHHYDPQQTIEQFWQ